MQQAGDPVFATALCRELVLPANLDLCLRVISILNHSKKRVVQCELLFYLCKCPSAESRLFIASTIPALLWIEWVLGGSLDGEEALPCEEDVAAIEVALLAAYQQDYNINPLIPAIRISSPAQPSIYHDGSLSKDADPEVYPFNVPTATISPPSWLYPSQPLENFDEYTRIVLTHRLCRYFQEHLSDVEDQVLAAYALLLARLAVLGTTLDSSDLFDRIQSGAIFASIVLRRAGRSSSDLSFRIEEGESLAASQAEDEKAAYCPLLPQDIASQLAFIFYSSQNQNQNQSQGHAAGSTPKARRRYPIKEDLLLLWSDSLASIRCRFPALEKHLRRCMLRRARTQAYPAAILALSC